MLVACVSYILLISGAHHSTLPAMSSERHQKPPFRAEHLGSLLRPDNLLQKRAEVDARNVDAQQLRKIEDDAVNDIVRMQEKLGFSGIV